MKEKIFTGSILVKNNAFFQKITKNTQKSQKNGKNRPNDQK